MFYETLSPEEIAEARRLVGPFTKPKQPRDTSKDMVTEMDKFRQTFALKEEDLTSAGKNQVVVDEVELLYFIKAAAAQDTAGLGRRHFMATASVSTTHDTDHAVGYGNARIEFTLQGSAWYIFKLPLASDYDQPGVQQQTPAFIFEVKAGSSVMIQGECHTWEYLVLRSDLLRPGPLELVNSHAVPRVTASVIYGDTQPKVQEVESTALPTAVTTPTQSTPRGHRHAKTKSVETIDTLSGGNNAWLPDQSNGKAIGSFQPTGYIQSRATNSQPILDQYQFKFLSFSRKMTK